MLLNALANMDRETMRRLAAAAVSQFAGMEPGRPVGGTYYLYRTLLYLGKNDVTPEVIGETLHVLLKYQSDIVKARKELQVPDGAGSV